MTEQLLTYLVESSVCLALFYLVYLVFLKGNTFFRWNRLYLISGLVLSGLIPMLEFNLSSENVSAIATDNSGIFTTTLSTIVVTGDEVEKNLVEQLSTFDILLWIYAIGALVFTILFGIQLFKLIRLIRSNPRTRLDDHIIVHTGGKVPCSSFMNYIFWDDTVDITSEKGQNILLHEQAHIRQKHSLDIIVFELSRIIFWFNPFIHLYRKEIVLVHEYLADKATGESGVEKDHYSGFLAQQALQSAGISFTHTFNYNIKNRLKMMTKKQTAAWKKIRYSIAIPVIATIVLVFSCQKNMNNDQAQTVDPENIEQFDQLAKALRGQTSQEALNTLAIVMKEHGWNMTVTQEMQKNPTPPVSIEIDANTKLINKVDYSETLTLDEQSLSWSWKALMDARKKIEPGVMQDPDGTYTKVEQMPEFKGGNVKLSEYLKNNIKYPDTAKNAKKECTILASFIIREDGSIDDINAYSIDDMNKLLKKKGLDSGKKNEADENIKPDPAVEAMKEEATRVLSVMPRWTPGYHNGEPVSVRLQLPVKFKLD